DRLSARSMTAHKVSIRNQASFRDEKLRAVTDQQKRRLMSRLFLDSTFEFTEYRSPDRVSRLGDRLVPESGLPDGFWADYPDRWDRFRRHHQPGHDEGSVQASRLACGCPTKPDGL